MTYWSVDVWHRKEGKRSGPKPQAFSGWFRWEAFPFNGLPLTRQGAQGPGRIDDFTGVARSVLGLSTLRKYVSCFLRILRGGGLLYSHTGYPRSAGPHNDECRGVYLRKSRSSPHYEPGSSRHSSLCRASGCVRCNRDTVSCQFASMIGRSLKYRLDDDGSDLHCSRTPSNS